MEKLILVCLSTMLGLSVEAQTQIKGVVTYYFNEYQGDKPDIGARVFFHEIDSTKLKSSFLIDYTWAKNLTQLIALTKKDKKSETERTAYLERLKVLNADTKAKMDSLDGKTLIKLLKIENDPDIVNATVDGIGNYSMNVTPGCYEVIIISKGRTAMTATEITGKLFHKSIIVLKDHTYNIDHKFDQY